MQEEADENLEVIKANLGERIPERIVEQTVELAESSGEAGSSGLGANDTTNAAVTAVAKPVGEARPPGFVKYSAASESELAKFFLKLGPLGSSWTRANGMNSALATAVVMSVGEARPPGFVKYSVMSESESELAESSGDDEFGPPWS